MHKVKKKKEKEVIYNDVKESYEEKQKKIEKTEETVETEWKNHKNWSCCNSYG